MIIIELYPASGCGKWPTKLQKEQGWDLNAPAALIGTMMKSCWSYGEYGFRIVLEPFFCAGQTFMDGQSFMDERSFWAGQSFQAFLFDPPVICPIWPTTSNDSDLTHLWWLRFDPPLMSQIWPTSNDSYLAHLYRLRFSSPLMTQIQPTTNDSDSANL